MSQTELERRVTDVLTRHAEDAMNSTNTEERLVELLDDSRTQDRRRHRRMLVAGVAAAAALAGLALWAATREDDGGKVQPAEPLTPVEVANGYIRAAATYDLTTAEAYLAADADLEAWDGDGIEGWRATQRWNQAVLFDIQAGPCEPVVTADQTFDRVLCRYTYNSLGSQELGFAPFEGSWFVVTVRDGEIVGLRDHLDYYTNQFNTQVWEPFYHWVKRNYPQDVKAMYDDGGASYETTDESVALWHAHLFEYIGGRLDQQ